MKLLRRPAVREALGASLLLLGLAEAVLAQSNPPAIGLLGQRSQMRVGEVVAGDPGPGATGAATGGNTFAQAHQLLTPDEKSLFDALLNMTVVPPAILTDSPFRRGPAPAASTPRRLTAGEQDILKGLLADGTLAKRASDGKSILEHLAALATCSPSEAKTTLSGTSLTLDLIRMLRPEDLKAAIATTDTPPRVGAPVLGVPKKVGHPLPGGLGEITQCTTHFTCGAASIEVWMRLNQTAELVRIAHQLHCDASASLHGSSLKPARMSRVYHAGDKVFKNESFKGDEGTEDRCDLDILLQSALMDKIALGNLSAYDVYADSGGIWNVIDGNSGGHPMYLKRELERLTGGSFAYAHSLNPYSLGVVGRFFGNLRDRTEQPALVDLVLNQCRAGKQLIICFQTRASDPMALHWVTIVGYQDSTSTVYIADTCEPKAERAKMYSMTKAELKDKLRCVVHQL